MVPLLPLGACLDSLPQVDFLFKFGMLDADSFKFTSLEHLVRRKNQSAPKLSWI